MYFDLQVNGYFGVDFNSNDLDSERLAVACQALSDHGVEGILATVITADLSDMCLRLQNICRARDEDELINRIVVGIHIEGPFISRTDGYAGAHPLLHIRPAGISEMQRLLDSANGIARLVTLAPECDPGGEVTRYLSEIGVTVSAGHCDPSEDELAAGIDAGLSMFTHLGNGCPLQMHRHNNVIQRVLARSDHLAIGFIADGIHVPYVALGNYLEITGFERAFVVTDAVSAAGLGPGVYSLGAQSVVVDENLATWNSDRQNLVGSALTMPAVAGRLQRVLGLSESQVDQLTYRNPRAAIHICC